MHKAHFPPLYLSLSVLPPSLEIITRRELYLSAVSNAERNVISICRPGDIQFLCFFHVLPAFADIGQQENYLKMLTMAG
jgi:hypothetical protein